MAEIYGALPSQILRLSDPYQAYVINKCCLLADQNRPTKKKATTVGG